jgi:hypothetical protein
MVLMTVLTMLLIMVPVLLHDRCFTFRTRNASLNPPQALTRLLRRT